MEYRKFAPAEGYAAPEMCYRLGASEIEAAEALAGLVQGSSIGLGGSTSAVTSQTAVPLSFDSNKSSSLGKTNEIVENTPIYLCCKRSQPTPIGKSGRKLTEAEKEERRIRRVLANRESARQTIRRRQAMHQELTRKAAELSEENEKLKNTKELVLKECNSQRYINVYLKAQLAKLKKTEPGEKQDNSKASVSASSCIPLTSTSATLSSQPSVVPFCWPSKEVPHFQYGSQSSHLLCPFKYTIPPNPTQQWQEGSFIPETTLVFVPIPCFLPFGAQTSVLHAQTATKPEEDSSSQLLYHRSLSTEQPQSSKETMSTGQYHSPPESSNHRSDDARCEKKPVDASAARWRRRDLMRMKHASH